MKDRKELKAFLKRMKAGRTYEYDLKGKVISIIKYNENKYGLAECEPNLLNMLFEYKIYTKHNLINLLLNEEEN